MCKGDIRVFEMEQGRRYGIKVIGDWNTHYRFKTPDGKKHRSIRAALAHLDAEARAHLTERVQNLAQAWHCKVSVA